MGKKVSVTSITPTLFYKIDGKLCRTLDRLDWHLKSLKLQRHVDMKILVVDQSKDEDIILELKKICSRHGAEYHNIKTNLIFNKSLMINYGLHLTKSEFVAILDLDLVFQHHVFWRCYLNYKEKGNFSNTKVLYLKDKKFLNLINLNADKAFRLRPKIHGNLARPHSNGKGIQGGIQFFETVFLRDRLFGCNTNINLLGGYDNDLVVRSKKLGVPVSDFYPIKDKIFCLHIPHVKYKNIYNIIPNDNNEVMKEVRRINSKAAYKSFPKSFIYQQEKIIGFRIIDNVSYYGNEHGTLFEIKSLKCLQMARGYFGT